METVLQPVNQQQRPRGDPRDDVGGTEAQEEVRRLEEADARPEVFALLLRDEPATGSFAPAEAAVVEGEADVAGRRERAGEPCRVDRLQTLIARAGDDGRPPVTRLEPRGKVQLAVETQAVAEERDRPALHHRAPGTDALCGVQPRSAESLSAAS